MARQCSLSPSEFDVAMNLIRSYLPNMMSMPNMQFSKHLVLSMHENGPRNIFVSEETVAKASLENYRKEEHTELVYMQHTSVSQWVVAILLYDLTPTRDRLQDWRRLHVT